MENNDNAVNGPFLKFNWQLSEEELEFVHYCMLLLKPTDVDELWVFEQGKVGVVAKVSIPRMGG